MGRLPLYREVKEKLIQELSAGVWLPGGKLPVEKALAERFEVGISTVRAAVGELEAAGILHRRQGKGTFVSEHAKPGRLYRFFNLVRGDGTRELPSRQFVSLRRDRASVQENELLCLSRYGGQRGVFRLRITFSLLGDTVGVSDATVPVGLFPGMNKSGLCDPGLPLYALYQNNYGVNVTSVAADLGAATAPADVADLLGVKQGSPVLVIERRAYTYGDVPVELRTSWVNTARCKFHVDQGSTV